DAIPGNNYITALCEDMRGRIWIGTDLGLCRYDEKTDGFERIEACSGLAIRTIVSDSSNRLWIASSNRLVMFDYGLDYKIGCDISQELNMNDIEYNSACTAGDRIYLGGCGGYIDFDSNDIEVDMRRYPVRLTSFEIHDTAVTPDMRRDGRVVLDRSVTLCDRIRLRHDENFFRIDFAMLDYTFGSGNTYSYMLEGYDKSPQTTDDTHPYALYSHIPPGRYTFRVEAVSSDGIRSENSAQAEIVISPAWYHSTAARIGYAVLFAGLCSLAVHLIRMRIRLSRELKQEIMQRERYDEINRTKMAFFTNISHEFKTPLTLILGPIETMLETADENQRRMLLVMKHNAERLLRLINQIMDLRKIDNDRMQVTRSMGDIVAFSREIFGLFSDHAARRHIDYTFESHPFCINSLFDCDKVEKIVYNLLSNAFKFTPDGGSIRLRIETDSPNGRDIIRLTVEDSGCGIAAEDLPHIFDRFYQTENRPHEQAEGSGIGLTLTRDYARLHGGDVAVESTPGCGSRFTVTLPYRNSSEPSAAAELAMSEQMPRTDDNRLKIVVVEDNEEMRDFLRSTLDGTYDVTTARDGRIGLEKIRQIVPDLIISDLMMPHMDGFELCRCVRDDAQTSHIPFIMLTAKNNEADIQTSYDCGADVFLSKPFSVKTLRTRIEALIESRAKLQRLYRKKILSTPSDIEVESENDKFILRVVRIIEENLENPDFNVSMLCDALDLSYLTVYRKVKALTGDTVNDFIRAVKLKRAAQYLRSGELRISEILYKSGFNSHSYFTKCFKEYFGMTPKEYMERSHS
ncbi:MAG: response regulator, partial [Alistipes sp.]|nr:response regulator [Alistipes sp.]